MTAKELSGLTHAELIEMVLQLYGENEQLKAQLSEKEKQAQKPAKTPSNSSVPPAAARKGKRAKTGMAKKRGGQPGHPGKSRQRSEPDVVIECHLDSCPDCGADLSETEQQLVGRSQVTEIPPIKPVVVEAERYGCRCPQCQRYQMADYPAGLEPERVFGARLEALVTGCTNSSTSVICACNR